MNSTNNDILIINKDGDKDGDKDKDEDTSISDEEIFYMISSDVNKIRLLKKTMSKEEMEFRKDSYHLYKQLGYSYKYIKEDQQTLDYKKVKESTILEDLKKSSEELKKRFKEENKRNLRFLFFKKIFFFSLIFFIY